jgi:hypothetical protein
MDWIHSGPDLSHAAKEGQPTMTDPKRTIPVSIPVVAATEEAGTSGASGTTDVTAQTVGANSALDKNPDARSTGGTATAQSSADANANANAAAAQPLPTNRDAELKKYRDKQAKRQAKLDKKKKKTQDQRTDTTKPKQSEATEGAQTPVGTPNSVSSPPKTTSNQNPPQIQ